MVDSTRKWLRWGVVLVALAALGCTRVEMADAGSEEDSGPATGTDSGTGLDSGMDMDSGVVTMMDSGPGADSGGGTDSGPGTDSDSGPGTADAGCMTGIFGASTFGASCFGS